MQLYVKAQQLRPLFGIPFVNCIWNFIKEESSHLNNNMFLQMPCFKSEIPEIHPKILCFLEQYNSVCSIFSIN